MNRFLALLSLLGALLAWAAPLSAQDLQPVPPFTARVVDRTGTLSPAGRQALEDGLAAFEKRKGSQIAVLIVPTTRPEAIEQYSIRVAEAWAIGRGRPAASRGSAARSASIDDGVLLLIAKEDRRLRIEVGYGLEGAIPDGIARRIIDEAIAPRLREQDWQGGIAAGIDALQRRIDGEDLPLPSARGGGDEDALAGVVPILLFGFVAGSVLSAIVGRFLGAGIAGVGSGVFGVAALGSMPLGVAVGAGVLALVLLMGGSRGRLHRVGRRTYHDGPVVLPGPWRGGGGFGGGGGGFGGGGGGFGGGGASGSW